jgi:hypothetical protein
VAISPQANYTNSATAIAGEVSFNPTASLITTWRKIDEVCSGNVSIYAKQQYFSINYTVLWHK